VKIFLLAFSFLTISFTQLQASSIKDHATMSYEAAAQFERCVGRKLSAFAKENFVQSNVNEDLNLVRKWLGYSHFYNPQKDVSTWRGTSMNRMVDSQNYLVSWKQSLSENSNVVGVQLALSELGHLVHHVQDSTVPSHVVPVKHWLHDAFEEYSAKYQVITLNCAEVPNSILPTDQLRQSALQTLSALKDNIQTNFRNTTRSLNWDYFWYDTGSKFGSYGYFGNKFGQTNITTPSGNFEISPDSYRDFWLARRTQSIHRSAQLLYWFFSNLIIEKGHSRVQMSDGTEISLEELLFEPQ
jgi:hypothetical protein